MPTPALYLNEFVSGLYTQRSPLVTPTSSQGLSTVVRTDILADGANMEMSNRSTLVRRAGFSRYCGSAFAAAETPLNFYSFRNLAGVVKTMVDTTNAVYVFDTNSLTAIKTKATTQQTAFCGVGNKLYWCDGTDAAKWDGATISKWGIAAPEVAPAISVLDDGFLSPTGGYRYVYLFKNSSTGHVSTASPASASTLAQTGKNFSVTGSRSLDPQVDQIQIYRTYDKGSVYYYLATIPNAGAGSWSYVDSATDDALNNFILAPLNHANDPAPAGISNIVYHMGRMWAVAGGKVYFSGGPDTTNGSGDESWPVGNYFNFPSAITALVSVSQGLLVFTIGDCYIIRGTDSGSFYAQLWMANFGAVNQNCVTADGDYVFVYTSRRQLFSISNQLDEIGYAIGDKLQNSFDPAQTYLTLHRSGTDSGLYISNGVDTLYRYTLNKESWSPAFQVVGGVHCAKSIAVSTSDYRLMVGRAVGGYILSRNLASWLDDGEAYPAYSTLGTLVIAPLGQTVSLDAILVERMPTGSDATVSVMLNEINGAFVELPNPASEPPLLAPASSIIGKRHYLKAAQTPLPQKARHLQVKISFPAENAENELLGFGLMKP